MKILLVNKQGLTHPCLRWRTCSLTRPTEERLVILIESDRDFLHLTILGLSLTCLTIVKQVCSPCDKFIPLRSHFLDWKAMLRRRPLRLVMCCLTRPRCWWGTGVLSQELYENPHCNWRRKNQTQFSVCNLINLMYGFVSFVNFSVFGTHLQLPNQYLMRKVQRIAKRETFYYNSVRIFSKLRLMMIAGKEQKGRQDKPIFKTIQ